MLRWRLLGRAFWGLGKHGILLAYEHQAHSTHETLITSSSEETLLAQDILKVPVEQQEVSGRKRKLGHSPTSWPNQGSRKEEAHARWKHLSHMAPCMASQSTNSWGAPLGWSILSRWLSRPSIHLSMSNYFKETPALPVSIHGWNNSGTWAAQRFILHLNWS